MKIVAKCGEEEVKSNEEILRNLCIGDIFVFGKSVYIKRNGTEAIKIGVTFGDSALYLGMVHALREFESTQFVVEPKPNAMLVLN